MENIKNYLIKLFEIDKVEEGKRKEMTEKIGNLVFQSVLIRVLPILQEEQLKEYEKMIENNEEGEKLFNFLNEKIPDFENIIKEEAELIRKDLDNKLK